MAALKSLGPVYVYNALRLPISSSTNCLPMLKNAATAANNCNCKSRKLSTGGKTSKRYDVVIVGGGIVGLATARELIHRHPQLSFAVLEKEKKLSTHQSGHNSGVMHAGIYYTPGSLRAQLCVEGLKLLYKYCDENDVPYKKCGKLIVALTADEVPRLMDLYKRGQQNGVQDLRLLGPKEIKEIEPNCVGVQAVHSPHTGIIDYRKVALSYAESFKKCGGDIHTGFAVCSFDVMKESEDRFSNDAHYPVVVTGDKIGQRLKCKYVVTCGGLQADRIAVITGASREPVVVPFRGDYLLLKGNKQIVNGNIYPVPNPAFPFLGVHFTPRMNGDIWLGPNAVLAFKREGYRITDFNIKDTIDALSYSGLRRLAAKNLLFGMKEMYRVYDLKAQVELLRKYVPSLSVNDVVRGPSGVRAQALDRSGKLIEDFVFDAGTGEIGDRILHVRNAPSPGATSSLAIAKMIADKVKTDFKL